MWGGPPTALLVCCCLGLKCGAAGAAGCGFVGVGGLGSARGGQSVPLPLARFLQSSFIFCWIFFLFRFHVTRSVLRTLDWVRVRSVPLPRVFSFFVLVS